MPADRARVGSPFGRSGQAAGRVGEGIRLTGRAGAGGARPGVSHVTTQAPARDATHVTPPGYTDPQ